jgi:filamentous hemagglutinin family protein
MSSRASLNHIYRTVWNQALGAMVAVAEISKGCVHSSGPSGAAGSVTESRSLFKPDLLAVLVAMAWGATPLVATSNPVGGVAVVGQASMATHGNQLTVTTQNGVGLNHSAINWQSFSIPAGNTTFFQQPNAASTVINRVVTHTPSQLFGTLGSNGNLVLVNQAGIAVGAGAVVDTAGFTASALRMTDADALNGRLRFGDASASSAGVSVAGNILARSGDVTLIGSQVDTTKDALIQAPNGATILAAGQSVSISGRGLEGIQLEVQAPSDSALNLGTLQGGAVGMFASTLKHSGQIKANTVSLEGGKVVLKASGDTYVQGNATIDATGSNGGSVDVLGSRVAVTDQAVIDASGQSGGGTVRVGGDYQGKNAAVPNASIAYFGPEAVVKADATAEGDGGKVIVWADDTTRAYGKVSARGGALGGNGGFVETSGKRYLDFQGLVDTRAPNGQAGSLLLDPSDITINATGPSSGGTTTGNYFTGGLGNSTLTWATINAQMAGGGLQIQTNSSGTGGNGDILITESGTLSNPYYLSLVANRNITFSPSVVFNAAGDVNMIAGWNGSGWAVTSGTGAINFDNATVNAANLFLSAGNRIDGPAATLTSNRLEIVGSASGGAKLPGGVVLSNPANMVNILSADISTAGSGALSFQNGKALSIGTGTYASGISAASNTSTIDIRTSVGALTVNSQINTSGDLTLKAANANISQTAAVTVGGTGTAWIDAGTGDVNLVNAANDFVNVELTGANISLIDVNDLHVAGVVAPTNTNVSIVSGGTMTTNAGPWSVGTGTLTMSSVGAFTTAGTVNGGTVVLSADGGLTLNHNVTATNALALSASGPNGVTNNATLSGKGSITTGAAGFTNNSVVIPGGAGLAGTLAVTGNMLLSGTSQLNLEMGGLGVGQSDKVTVDGALTLGGTLNASGLVGYTPGGGDAIPVVTMTGARTGTFTTTNLPPNYTASYGMAPNEAVRLIHAAPGSVVFTNAVGGLQWSTAGNWNTNALPVSTDSVLLSSGYAVEHASGADSIAALTINSANSLNVSGGSLAVTGATNVSGALTVSGGTMSLNGASNIKTLNLSGGTINGTGSLNIASGAVANHTEGTLAAINVNVASGGTYNISNTSAPGGATPFFNPGIFNNSGTVNWNGSNEQRSPQFNTVFNNLSGGQFNIQNNQLWSVCCTGSFTFNNQAGATVTKSTTGISSFTGAGAFNNSGTVNVSAGTLQLEKDGTDTGTYTVANGANLKFISGIRDMNAGSNITGGGNLQLSGSALNINGGLGIATTGQVTVGAGAVNFNVPLTFTNPLTLSGGQLDTVGGTGNLTTNGLVWSGGADLVGTGTLTTHGTTNITGAGAGIGRNWTNDGTVNISGIGSAGFWGANNLTWTNASGGIINLSGSDPAPIYTATNTGHSLVNTGQINKNPLSGTGQTIGDANLAVINGGVGGGGINVHEGTLVIGGALTLNPTSGVFVANGATFSRPAGFINNGTLTGNGTLMVGMSANGLLNQGTINPGGTGVAGTLNVSGDLQLGTGSVVNLEMGGTGVGQSDKLTVTNDVTLGGTLNASLLPGYTPVNGDGIPFLTMGGIRLNNFVTANKPANFNVAYGMTAGEAARLIYGTTGTVTFTNTFGNLQWGNTANWSSGSLPIATEAALISGGHSVVHSSGNDTVGALTINGSNGLDVSGGTLNVLGTTALNGTLTVSGTGSAVMGGAVNGSATGQINVSGGSLSLGAAASLAGLNQTGGIINGAGSLNVAGVFSQPGGSIGLGGPVSISQNAGNLSVGNVSASLINLSALNGGIAQTGGLVTAGLLSTHSLNGATLNNAGNQIGSFSATSSGVGNIAFTNVGALNIQGINVANGNLSVVNTGGVTTSGAISVSGGTTSLTANSPLVIGSAGLTSSGDVALTATNLTSTGNMTINGPVTSTAGAAIFNAANNYGQYNTVTAANGISVTAGGTISFGPSATAVGAPVTFTASGLPVAPPVAPTVTPPLAPTVTPPIAPPVTPPVTAPETTPVTPPVAPPVTPPETTPPQSPVTTLPLTVAQLQTQVATANALTSTFSINFDQILTQLIFGDDTPANQRAGETNGDTGGSGSTIAQRSRDRASIVVEGSTCTR